MAAWQTMQNSCCGVGGILLLLVRVVFHATFCEGVTYTGDVSVGILHSLSGTMAISEVTVVNAEQMAIQEINDAGGLLGKRIVPIVEDGMSDWDVFAQKAELFTNPTSAKYVKVVFGCWTSASRKKVLPIFEKNNHMLFYPVQYEGQECSKNIFYTGAAPNQQIEPAVDWLMRFKGKEFFLVGSDYVFPRTANAIIRGQLAALGGKVVGEMYLPLGEDSDCAVEPIINAIKLSLPNGGVIFNTLNGGSNVKFFRMFYDAGLRAATHPTMSVSITETEIAVIGVQYLIGHYAAWNYFMSTAFLPTCDGGFDPAPSKQFVDRYRAKFGANKLVNDPMESAYIAVYLWAQAVQLAGTFELEQVRRTIVGQAFPAPEGEVTMNENHHISKFVRIGQVQAGNGDFKIVYTGTNAVFPQPWNQYVSTTRGYACDWLDTTTRGGFYPLQTIDISLVHALNGANEAVERKFLEGELVAIRDLNRDGGLLGRTILPSIEDTGSDNAAALALFRTIAMKLNGSAAIFGNVEKDAQYEAAVGDTRKTTSGPPLLFSPVRSTGGQCAEHVLHFGSTTNQQVMPALKHFSASARAGGKSSQTFYIVYPPSWGTDGALAQVKLSVSSLSDSVAGQAAVGLAADVPAAVADLKAKMPNGGVVLNLMETAALAKALLLQMQADGLPPGAFPTVSFDVTGTDIPNLGALLSNQYVSFAYFASVETSANVAFVKSMQEWYGTRYIVDDEMASAYTAVRYWAQAVKQAGSFDTQPVQRAMWAEPYGAPSGPVTLFEANYISKPNRLATLNARGDAFRVIAGDSQPYAPDPAWLFPGSDASCNFKSWMKLLCVPGQGLISTDGSFLTSRDGAVNCDWCTPGSSSKPITQAGYLPTSICVPCPIGTSQPDPGKETCELCDFGTVTAVASSASCSFCGIGTYASVKGLANCTMCAAPTTTRLRGSTNVTDCVCPRGKYRTLGSMQCVPCPYAMDCGLGSDEHNRPESVANLVITRETPTYPVPQSGYWSTYEEPFSIYQCLPSGSCPGGNPEVCPPNQGGLACGKCDDGYFMARSLCEPCGMEASPALFIFATLFIGPALVFLLHWRSQDKPAKWDSPANTFVCLAFIMLMHVQTLAVFRGFSLTLPKVLLDFWSVFAFTADVISIVQHECASFGGKDYAFRSIFKMAGPLYAALIFGIAVLASKVLRKIVPALLPLQLNKDVLWNVYGGVYFTFYISIAAASFSLFQCYQHPNDKFSVRNDSSFLCFEDSWASVVVIAIIAILVFCVGALSVFCRVLYLAPAKFHEPQFQMRWKFLLIKFRPGVFWWSIPLLFRGMALNLSVAFFFSGAEQTIWALVTALAYLAAVTLLMPWRSMLSLALDLTSCISLVLICVVVGQFSQRQKTAAESQGGDSQSEDENGDIELWSVILSFVPMFAFAVLSCFPAHSLFKQRSPLYAPIDYTEQADEIAETLRQSADPEVLERVMMKSSRYDVMVLEKAQKILSCMALGKGGKTEGSIFSQRIPENMCVVPVPDNMAGAGQAASAGGQGEIVEMGSAPRTGGEGESASEEKADESASKKKAGGYQELEGAHSSGSSEPASEPQILRQVSS